MGVEPADRGVADRVRRDRSKAGRLVITHDVGPMRTYCIGAALLDLRDPTRVLGRLRESPPAPEGSGREGYVPNAVCSRCSLIHGRDLILCPMR